MMYLRRLVLKKSKSLLLLNVENNRLIIKEKDKILYDIPIDQIEIIRVDRILGQANQKAFEVNILGHFIEFAKIQLNRKQSFHLKSWLEKIIEQREKIDSFVDFESPYTARGFRAEWLDHIWQIVAVIVILALLAYIFFIGLPGLRRKPKQNEESTQTYQYYLEEGKKLVDQDRLTDGINHLEDAKQIKDTPEIQTLLDNAYLERAEFYYQSKDYQKSLRDHKMIRIPSKKSEKLAALLSKEIDFQYHISAEQLKNFQEIMHIQWEIKWNQARIDSNGLLQTEGKRFDSDRGIIFSSSYSGKSEDKITKVLFKTELMQKEVTENYTVFDLVSQEYLSTSSQLSLNPEERLQISNWIDQWYPKIINSNFQIKEQIADFKLILMGEKGIRYLEINLVEDKKKP